MIIFLRGLHPWARADSRWTPGLLFSTYKNRIHRSTHR